MAYFSILLLFLLEHYRGIRIQQEWDSWLPGFSAMMDGLLQRSVLPPVLHPLLVIGLPCLALVWLQHSLDHVLFGLPEFALMVVTLFYSLGREDLGAVVHDYLVCWRAGDTQGAYHQASRFSHSEPVAGSGDLAQLHCHAAEAVLYQGFERWFAVVFWFIVLGPWAALAYRLAWLYTAPGGDAAQANRWRVDRFIRLIEWLPAHILACSYALAGNFASCYKTCREQFARGGHSTPVLLRICGIAALGQNEVLACQGTVPQGQRLEAIREGSDQIEALVALQHRAAIVWLVAMALAILLIG